jgi:hypothetical protein
MFTITHASIRELVKSAHRYKYFPVVGDALSLAREQVEKVFIIAALLNNPNESFRQYLRSSWRNRYEGFLLDLEEQSENERFDEYLTTTFPEILDRLRQRRVSRRKTEIIVSNFAKRAVKHKWDNPGDEKPFWFIKNEAKKKKKENRYKKISTYVRDYFEFATPGMSVRLITDPELRRFLYRWHKEYSFLSQYTHVTVRKMVFADMLQQKGLKSQQPIKEYGVDFSIRAINTSYTAAATACALVLDGVSNRYGANIEVKEFWDQLTGFSLLSKALWKMHIKSLLP